ncbi:AraC family transcriptional regulator [Aquimarina sp. I32.4]|uniref:helix-turn-helix domain-containing protein n=1 Tax=Aquimarina sp. I32.4 TaxID=2053903 RepID=UPI000CDEDFBF|nr:helix-turn-helix domain-containing protein [Aquimarina sp. I32.4]
MNLKKPYPFFVSFYIRLFIILFLSSIQSSLGQEKDFEIPDSLKAMSYDSIYTSYRKTWRDTIQSKIYLRSCLKKAITENNTIKMAQTYCMLSYYAVEESEKIALLDRSIALSKGSGDKMYPIVAYSFKGGYYLKKCKYSLALDSYLALLSVAEKVQNSEFITVTKHNIACIKTEIGKHQEGLPLFKENFAHIIANHSTDTTRFLKSSIALAESYRYNQLLDSASLYNSKAIQLSKKPGVYYDRFYGKIIVNEGINLFFKHQYKTAYDSISKGLLMLNKSSIEYIKTHVLGEFYLGKIHLKQQNKLATKTHFIKVDSILQKEKITPIEIREGYEFLINSFKTYGQKEKQLEYINKLLKFDSIINKEASFVSSRLFKEFDTPLLLKEKEVLITELTGDNKHLNLAVIFLSIISIVILLFLYIQFQKKKVYQQKFEKLIHQNTQNQSKTSKNNPSHDIGVPDDTVKEILTGLAWFEQNHLYLHKNISTTSLAKDIKTNTKYLSKVINHHKNKNFINYINDLRITYAVNELKKNKTLKNYTIQGIAEEMGFNTAESFSSAFKKSTGIKTSYFIKKLHTEVV